MELSKLERKFFDEVLNAELDVPLNATLQYEGNDFDIIVVPEISSEGWLTLEYFNAPPYQPETQYDDSGGSFVSGSIEDLLGMHPLLKQAWDRNHLLNLQLSPSATLIQNRVNPNLEVYVQYANWNHRGELTLHENRVRLEHAALKKAEFCVVDFPDFATPEKQWASVEGIGESEQVMLRSIADKLEDDAKLTIQPAQHYIVLETGDGWKIRLTKDESQTRDLVSHTGVIEKDDGSEFEPSELHSVLEGLRYFLAFTTGTYIFPTAVVGYNTSNKPVWGQIGKFVEGQRHPTNWFNNSAVPKVGRVLEELFPEFWCKWTDKQAEIIAVIESYVDSNAMRRAGLPHRAMATSYSGLEVLAGLASNKTIDRKLDKAICQVLSTYRIPNTNIEESKNPVTTRIRSELGVCEKQGPYLLNNVRNYVIHPLDKNQQAQIKETLSKYLDTDKIQYVYLHDLSQFYLEYILLKYCNFDVGVDNHRRLLESY